MSKRTPRFFLKRFKRGKKRNPPYSSSAYTPGGAFIGSTITASSPRALRKKLAARGLDVSSIKLVRKARKSKRRVARKSHRKARRTIHRRKARRARKTHMKRKSRRSARSRIKSMKRSRSARSVGKIYRRKVRGKKYALKVLGSRRGRGKKRKVHAVRWSGKKGSKIYRALSYGSRHKKGTHVIGFTNPKKRRKHRARRSTRRNPGVAAEYIGGLTGAPNKIMGLFKGPGMIKNVAFTAGGAVGTFMIGGVISSKLIKPLLEKIAPSFAAQVADPSTIQARIVGGALPYTAAFVITKLFGKKMSSEMKTALMLGGALASAVELIRPGMVGDLLKKVGLGELPYAGPTLAGLGALNGPVCGLGYTDALAGYVEAPSYAGTNGYVEAPSYAGTNGIAGYVEAPSYAGTAGDVLAGTFLDDAVDNSLNNNWLSDSPSN